MGYNQSCLGKHLFKFIGFNEINEFKVFWFVFTPKGLSIDLFVKLRCDAVENLDEPVEWNLCANSNEYHS